MSIAGWIIEGILFAFIGFLWVRLITDWVQMFARSWEPRGAALVFLELSYSATDPPINALRKVIKPIRIGNFALDLSFFLVMVVAYILLSVNRSVVLF